MSGTSLWLTVRPFRPAGSGYCDGTRSPVAECVRRRWQNDRRTRRQRPECQLRRTDGRTRYFRLMYDPTERPNKNISSHNERSADLSTDGQRSAGTVENHGKITAVYIAANLLKLMISNSRKIYSKIHSLLR